MGVDAEDITVPPYYELLGIEIVDCEPGFARGRLPLTESISLSGSDPIAHGGAVASLADATGYWAVSASNDMGLTPTIDLRVDYLAPATDDLVAEASVARNGASVGVVDVAVETDERQVAAARGVFKTGGSGSWSAGE